MTNVKTFDASEVMREISKLAPFAILICALLSFITVGIFSVDYYESLLSVRFPNSRPLAILLAIIQEAVRFGLLIASIKDFTDDRKFNGWIGLIASLLLVWHDISIASEIAEMWDKDKPEQYYSILVFLILIGLVLEFRLILTVGNSREKGKANRVNGQKNERQKSIPNYA